MYTPLALYDLDGHFLAYTIAKTDVDGALLKLHTTNVWAHEDSGDLTAQLERLNDQSDILAYWPDVRDPEVQDLLNDPTWEPAQLFPIEVPDENLCVYFYHDPPREEDGFPGTIDEENSIIVMKTVMAPSSAATMNRVKLACETIARRRNHSPEGTP